MGSVLEFVCRGSVVPRHISLQQITSLDLDLHIDRYQASTLWRDWLRVAACVGLFLDYIWTQESVFQESVQSDDKEEPQYENSFCSLMNSSP